MKTAGESGDTPKPLAAYRLGLLSRTFSMWQALFLEKPEFEWGTADGVRLVIEELSEAVVNLAAEIPVNVYGELRAWLDEQNKCWTSVWAMVCEYHVGKAPWDRQLVADAGTSLNPDLRTLVDLASEQLSGLLSWFQLGAAVGECDVLHHDLGDSHPTPGVDRIVAIARTLPKQTTCLVPVLEKLLEHASESPKLSTRSLLTRVIEPTDGSSDSEIYGASYDAFVAGSLVHALDLAIQESLRGVVGPEAGPSLDEQALKGLKPRWEKERDGLWVGELRVGDRVQRRVRHLAKNIIPILDAFEEEGWPVSVLDPLSGDDPQRRHETIRSLNEGLTRIRFHGDGTNEGIKWDWA